jgi:hypothetical protein
VSYPEDGDNISVRSISVRLEVNTVTKDGWRRFEITSVVDLCLVAGMTKIFEWHGKWNFVTVACDMSVGIGAGGGLCYVVIMFVGCTEVIMLIGNYRNFEKWNDTDSFSYKCTN